MSRCSPPDDHAADSGRFGLEDDQVADTRLVRAPAVVDDEDVARRGELKREEDVDASEAAGRQRPPCDALPGHDGAEPRWRGLTGPWPATKTTASAPSTRHASE